MCCSTAYESWVWRRRRQRHIMLICGACARVKNILIGWNITYGWSWRPPPFSTCFLCFSSLVFFVLFNLHIWYVIIVYIVCMYMMMRYIWNWVLYGLCAAMMLNRLNAAVRMQANRFAVSKLMYFWICVCNISFDDAYYSEFFFVMSATHIYLLYYMGTYHCIIYPYFIAHTNTRTLYINGSSFGFIQIAISILFVRFQNEKMRIVWTCRTKYKMTVHI